MYEGIKQVTGKSTKKTAPLKSKTGEVITDKSKQMGRWVEHYLELYSRENSVTQEALDAIEDMPILEELDSEPTVEELSKQSMLWPVVKHLAKTAFHTRSSNVESQPS